MIIDSSAILAILFDEPDAPVYACAMAGADRCRLSAATYAEVSIIADAQGDGRSLDTLFKRLDIRIEPVTEEQAKIAREAYRDYGKGRHAAALNFGDCFSYALAKDLHEPLLFKGNDFSKTDILAVT